MRWTDVVLVLQAAMLAAFMGCASPEPVPEPSAEAQTTSQPGSAASSPEAQLEEIETRLNAVKTQLFDEGEYNCCVDPPCNWCALHEGSCACFTNLDSGEAVCPGCGLGWHNGQGVVEGVDPDDVEWTITHEHPEGAHEH